MILECLKDLRKQEGNSIPWIWRVIIGWIPLTKGEWHGALILSLTNGWVNTQDSGDSRRHRVHYDVTVMSNPTSCLTSNERLRNDMCRKGSAKRCIWKNNWGCKFCSQYIIHLSICTLCTVSLPSYRWLSARLHYSSASAMELLQYCPKPLICDIHSL